MNIARISLGLWLSIVCGCALGVTAQAQAQDGKASSPPAPAAAAPPPPTPVAFDAALLKAANDLLSKAKLDASPTRSLW